MDMKSVCQMIDRVLEILSTSLSMMKAVTRATQHQQHALFWFFFSFSYKVPWSLILFVKSTQDVDIWMDIPIQHDVYIWANYSVSSYLQFTPICWNVLIWLKYEFMLIFVHHLSLYFDVKSLRPLRSYREWNTGANTDIWGQIRIFEGKYGYLHRTCPEDK